LAFGSRSCIIKLSNEDYHALFVRTDNLPIGGVMMDKLPKDDHDSIDATWLTEEPYLDIIPEDPPQETEILYCQCKKPSSVYQESNDLGHWLKCGNCNRVIEGSFEPLKPY
jgi:hypothetical protein